MSRSLHKFWLKVAAIVIGSFGPVFFLGTMPETMEPARLTLDLLSWPVDGATTYASPDTRFLSALTGGFLLGWGVTIWCLSAWFLLDSAGSIASGNESNALFNVAILLVAVGPLWFPARH